MNCLPEAASINLILFWGVETSPLRWHSLLYMGGFYQIPSRVVKCRSINQRVCDNMCL